MAFFEGCIQLSRMVGERNITVLLCKLFAETMINAREDPAYGNLPQHIPDLVLATITKANRYRESDQPDDATVHRLMKNIAWICIEPGFHPGSRKIEFLMKTMTGEAGLEAKLKYLTRLGLLQVTGIANERIRVALDPIAEYLAGIHMVELYGTGETAWKDFLEVADRKAQEGTIFGFLQALRDCMLAKGQEHDIYDIVKELRHKIDLALNKQ